MSSIFPSTIKEIVIYNASFGTRELGPAMLSAIHSVYPNPSKISITYNIEKNRDDKLYIIICPAGLCDMSIPQDTLDKQLEHIRAHDNFPLYYIVWQLEDIQGNNNNLAYLTMLRRAISVWDYSLFNIRLLKERDNINAIYCPPGFNETITTPDILNGTYVYCEEDKDIDILFLGYCEAYPRRIKLRNEIYRTGLRCWFVSDLDINGMKAAIKRSKICINMASMDTFVLAKIRLNILLSNQVCIVSEISCDTEADVLYSEAGITFVPYDKIVPTVKQLISDPILRKENAIKGYNWYKTRPWTSVFDFNHHLPNL